MRFSVQSLVECCSPVIWALVVMPAFVAAQEKQSLPLAKRAYDILQTHCYRCHGGTGRAAGLDVLDRESLLLVRGQNEDAFQMIVPGKPENSQFWDAIDSGYMPDEGSDEANAMTEEDRQTLKEWIAAGVPFPDLREQKFVSNKQVMTAIRDYLLTADADDRKHLRFFTLNHIQNDPKVSNRQLRLYRAGLSMAINSLSLRRRIVLPESIPNTEDSVYAIDTRDVGWDQQKKWEQILSLYPYGLKFNHVRDDEFRSIVDDIEQLAGTPLPQVRADWFTVTATQPPLYHILLEVPQQLADLEEQLNVDRIQNFLHNDLHRSGFSKSNVSQQNRLVERHESSNTPYYWISYDFKPRKARGDLLRFPLGPVDTQNKHNQFAFKHDGGEVIWSLPNGLQGYMLTDAVGNRIDRGPIDVVFDKSPVLGTPEIMNGISCMICHRQGMITGFIDEVRDANAVGGDSQKKVSKIYAKPEILDELLLSDRQRFMRSLKKVMGPFLQVEEDSEKSIESFSQPIAYIASEYFQDLGAEQVAYELGLKEIEPFQFAIRSNRGLQKLGLGNLIGDTPGTMKREKWEAIEGTSLMQDVSLELRVGTPFRQTIIP